jgi:cell division protein FtsL
MFLILAVSLIGCGAISIVWLRMEISATAKNCGKLEDQREMVARELRELRGKKSAMMRPSTIAQLVEGRLRVPSPQKTIYVTEREMSSFMNSKIARNDDLSRRQYLNRQ